MKRGIRKIGRWLAAIAISCLSVSGAASAQTVRPVVNELGNPAKGWVEYVNDSLSPLNVVLEPKSFTVSDTGEISYRELDPGIHLRLSTTSFRIQPKQTYYVTYEASAAQSPAWFVLYAAFSGFPFRLQHAMNTRLLLPHTVYLLPKQSVDKSQVHVERAELIPSENKVLLDVANTGDYFGRVMETQLLYSRKKQDAPGFPVFPHSHRILEIPLEQKPEGEDAPIKVLVRFQNFKLEEKLQRRSVTASAGDP